MQGQLAQPGTGSLHTRGCSLLRCKHAPPVLRRRRLALTCASAASPASGTGDASRVAALRKLLDTPGLHKGPCCHDALSARLIERAGFPLAFMSGFSTSAARLGAPDTGLMSYYEMLDQGRYVHEATRTLPVIGDGDTGYGNALNVKRTVRGYAAAGFAGILIEDQVSPKSCGHVRGKAVVDRQEAVARIRAAADARDEGADIVVVARTDARQAVSLEEALWRVAAFADAGADVLFIDALASREEMAAFGRAGGGAARLPKMANMLEGGGKTPILAPEELEGLGFRLVAYPLSLLGVSVRAMEDALAGLRRGQLPAASAMPSFQELQEVVGFPDYYAEEARYAVPRSPAAASAPAAPPAPAALAETMGDRTGSQTAGTSAPTRPPDVSEEDWTVLQKHRQAAARASQQARPAPSGGSASQQQEPAASISGREGQQADVRGGSDGPPPGVLEEDWAVLQRLRAAAREVVEPDAIIPASRARGGRDGTRVGSSTNGASDLVVSSSGRQTGESDAGRRERFLRIRITDLSTAQVKLETRFPAGFLDGIGALVPEVAGVDLEGLVRRARGDPTWSAAQALVDFESNGDRVQVFIETNT